MHRGERCDGRVAGDSGVCVRAKCWDGGERPELSWPGCGFERDKTHTLYQVRLFPSSRALTRVYTCNGPFGLYLNIVFALELDGLSLFKF